MIGLPLIYQRRQPTSISGKQYVSWIQVPIFIKNTAYQPVVKGYNHMKLEGDSNSEFKFYNKQGEHDSKENCSFKSIADFTLVQNSSLISSSEPY